VKARARTPAPRRRFGLRRFIHVYHLIMPRNPRRERLFLAALAFLLTFAFIRGLTYSIRYNIGPFHNISVGGTHVHHLVWGILLLLVVGYAGLIEFGTRGPVSNFVTRLGAIAFGIGAALTLDEFALWLNLQDVYWERQGRVSIDAVAIFAALLLVAIFGKDLIRALAHEVGAMLKGASWAEREAYLEYQNARGRHDDAPSEGSAGSVQGSEGTQEAVDRPS
jgi:hypothetical protein